MKVHVVMVTRHADGRWQVYPAIAYKDEARAALYAAEIVRPPSWDGTSRRFDQGTSAQVISVDVGDE